MTSNLTPEQLADAVAKIAELDAKRTQGEWSAECRKDACYYRGKRNDGWLLEGPYYVPDYENPMLAKDDAKFIATAPLMAQVIRQLWEEREASRAVMEQAREALGKADKAIDAAYTHGLGVQLRRDANKWRLVKKRFNGDKREALAALDAALGRV